MNNPSPLETLASYAITFVAGALSVIAVSAYGKWMKHQGRTAGPVVSPKSANSELLAQHAKDQHVD